MITKSELFEWVSGLPDNALIAAGEEIIGLVVMNHKDQYIETGGQPVCDDCMEVIKPDKMTIVPDPNGDQIYCHACATICPRCLNAGDAASKHDPNSRLCADCQEDCLEEVN